MSKENEDLDDDLDLDEGGEGEGNEPKELAEGGGVEVEIEDEATGKRDAELDEAEDDAEREAIKEKRRKERRNKAQRYKEKLESQDSKIAALMAQNAELLQKVTSIQDASAGAQLAQVDQMIVQANKAAEQYKALIAEATVKQDGRTVAEATEYMIAARNRAVELSAYKQNATRAMNAPKPLNPAMVSKSQQFLGKNTWYGGPQSADPDSKVLTALDNSLTAEGWDSTSDAYWNELESRAKKYLPHRFAKESASSGGETRRRNSSPVPGGNSSGGSGEKGNTFTLSPGRVQAIKDAGMWDDPKGRAAMIKSFRDYDRDNKG